MNRETKKGYKLPLTIDSFNISDDGYWVEYDGWHFEARTQKATINKVLKYIFKGGEE